MKGCLSRVYQAFICIFIIHEGRLTGFKIERGNQAALNKNFIVTINKKGGRVKLFRPPISK